jgi:hypothetical protein
MTFVGLAVNVYYASGEIYLHFCGLYGANRTRKSSCRFAGILDLYRFVNFDTSARGNQAWMCSNPLVGEELIPIRLFGLILSL